MSVWSCYRHGPHPDKNAMILQG